VNQSDGSPFAERADRRAEAQRVVARVLTGAVAILVNAWLAFVAAAVWVPRTDLLFAVVMLVVAFAVVVGVWRILDGSKLRIWFTVLVALPPALQSASITARLVFEALN
jgi:hypothetical protein